MTELQIRKATPSDLPQILDLLAQPDMDGGDPLPLADAEVLRHRSPQQELFVILADGEVVGTFTAVLIQHLSHHGVRSAVIEDVVVRGTWQRLGVGRTMMEWAANYAKDAGCYKMMLSSGLKRTWAHQFYEQLGWERHGYSFLLPLSGGSSVHAPSTAR